MTYLLALSRYGDITYFAQWSEQSWQITLQELTIHLGASSSLQVDDSLALDQSQDSLVSLVGQIPFTGMFLQLECVRVFDVHEREFVCIS